MISWLSYATYQGVPTFVPASLSTVREISQSGSFSSSGSDTVFDSSYGGSGSSSGRTSYSSGIARTFGSTAFNGGGFAETTTRETIKNKLGSTVRYGESRSPDLTANPNFSNKIVTSVTLPAATYSQQTSTTVTFEGFAATTTAVETFENENGETESCSESTPTVTSTTIGTKKITGFTTTSFAVSSTVGTFIRTTKTRHATTTKETFTAITYGDNWLYDGGLKVVANTVFKNTDNRIIVSINANSATPVSAFIDTLNEGTISYLEKTISALDVRDASLATKYVLTQSSSATTETTFASFNTLVKSFIGTTFYSRSCISKTGASSSDTITTSFQTSSTLMSSAQSGSSQQSTTTQTTSIVVSSFQSNASQKIGSATAPARTENNTISTTNTTNFISFPTNKVKSISENNTVINSERLPWTSHSNPRNTSNAFSLLTDHTVISSTTGAVPYGHTSFFFSESKTKFNEVGTGSSLGTFIATEAGGVSAITSQVSVGDFYVTASEGVTLLPGQGITYSPSLTRGVDLRTETYTNNRKEAPFFLEADPEHTFDYPKNAASIFRGIHFPYSAPTFSALARSDLSLQLICSSNEWTSITGSIEQQIVTTTAAWTTTTQNSGTSTTKIQTSSGTFDITTKYAIPTFYAPQSVVGGYQVPHKTLTVEQTGWGAAIITTANASATGTSSKSWSSPGVSESVAGTVVSAVSTVPMISGNGIYTQRAIEA
jgi:hypothetical protein